MPPSGYSPTQATHIHDFLASCGHSLVREGEDLGRSPVESLQRELENIDALRNSSLFSDVEKVLFALNGAFYELLLAQHPKTYSELSGLIGSVAKVAQQGFLAVENRSSEILATVA
jgi:hypothetical protein